jgi:hypothetical protein
VYVTVYDLVNIGIKRYNILKCCLQNREIYFGPSKAEKHSSRLEEWHRDHHNKYVLSFMVMVDSSRLAGDILLIRDVFCLCVIYVATFPVAQTVGLQALLDSIISEI